MLELGQMAFGKPTKEYDVPVIWRAALEYLAAALSNAGYSHGNPFENVGSEFVCDVFEVFSYDWNDGPERANFKWRDVEISWYKYLGRGMSSNKKLTPQMASKMLLECLAALTREGDNDKI